MSRVHNIYHIPKAYTIILPKRVYSPYINLYLKFKKIQAMVIVLPFVLLSKMFVLALKSNSEGNSPRSRYISYLVRWVAVA